MSATIYKSKTPWTEQDDSFIEAFYIQLSSTEIAERLSRTRSEVKSRIKKLGLTYTPEQIRLKKQAAMQKCFESRNDLFTESELEYFKTHYPTMQNRDLSIIMGRSESTIAHKAHDLGLKKTAEFRTQLTKKAVSKAFIGKLRPSQSLTDKYILRAVMQKPDCSEESIKLYAKSIELHRSRIMQNRQKKQENGKNRHHP